MGGLGLEDFEQAVVAVGVEFSFVQRRLSPGVGEDLLNLRRQCVETLFRHQQICRKHHPAELRPVRRYFVELFVAVILKRLMDCLSGANICE